MERWLPVLGFEGLYEVSDLGRVRNAKGRLKRPTIPEADPRPFVLLWRDNKPKMLRIHTVVLSAFVGPKPEGMEGCHYDGNCQNNRLGNLRWDTPKGNHADKGRHGTTNRGERCGNAKLSKEQVAAIREDNRLQREIAADYGIRQNTVSRIKSKVRWAYD